LPGLIVPAGCAKIGKGQSSDRDPFALSQIFETDNVN